MAKTSINVKIMVTIYWDGSSKGGKMTQDEMPKELYQYLCGLYVIGQNRLAQLTNGRYAEWNSKFNEEFPNHEVDMSDPQDLYMVYIRDLERKYATDIMNKDLPEGMRETCLRYDIGDECQLVIVDTKTRAIIDFELMEI